VPKMGGIGAAYREIQACFVSSAQLGELRRGVHVAGTPRWNRLKIGVRVEGSGTSMTFKRRRNPTSTWRDIAKVCSSAQLNGLRTRG
jgi:hypothetical protein